jgi:hypothetical protein
MARQGGQVQLERSDMRLALNMAELAKECFSCAAIEEMKYILKKSCAEVREGNEQGVKFPGHKQVKAAIQRHPAMLRQNHTSGCLPCLYGTSKRLQTRWRRKGTGAPLLARRREQILELTSPPPSTPPTPTRNTSVAQPAEIINFPAGYTYSHTALPGPGFFQDDEDTEHDTGFYPDMLTDKG